MKIAYAFRRSNLYPYQGHPTALPEGKARTRFLRAVQDIGFDGLELAQDALGGSEATEAGVRELRKELEDNGTPCVVVKGGGGLHDYRVTDENRGKLENAIDIAAWVGASVVNTGSGVPPRGPGRREGNGWPESQGSSRTATEEDFSRAAAILHDLGNRAGDKGLIITLEVHQHSIIDNSWSAIHMLELADSPYVFANPDLGNILWTYEVPEETSEDAILALAPHSRYWHCKNLQRIHIPENEHSLFIRVPLPDGEIDYRFAISAMHDSGFDGYLAIEGATSGDQLSADRRSIEYVRGILRELD